MRRFILFVLCLAILRPDVAWTATCTTQQGTPTWSDITTITSDCVEGAPTSADVFDIPIGSVPGVTGDLNWADGDDRGIICRGGLTLDAVIAGEALNLEIGYGQDGEPATYTGVSLYALSSCVLNVKAGWATIGQETPSLEYTISRDSNTVWTVPPSIVPCGTGTNDVTGAVGNCAAGNEEGNLCFVYDLPVVDPANGTATSEGWITESVGALATDFTLYARSGMEVGMAYPISVLDSTADIVEVCIDVTQAGHNYTNASGDNPEAEREIVEVNVMAAVAEGETCVSVDAGTLAATGDMAGWCFRPEGSCECSRTIKTIDNTNCAGGVGDALYFAPEDRQSALALNSDGTLEIAAFECGDEFAIGATVNIQIHEARAEGEGLVVIDSASGVIDGLTLSGASLELRSTGIQPTNTVVFQGGDGAADRPSITVSGNGSFSMFSSSAVGSGTGGGSGGIGFDGFLGDVFLDYFAVRHKGDDAIESIGAATTYERTFSHVRCEFMDPGTDLTVGCVTTNGDWPTVSVGRYTCLDCIGGTAGTGASLFAGSSGDPFTATQGAVLGATDGGLSLPAGTGKDIAFVGLVVRGARGQRTGSAGYAFARLMNGFSIYDYDLWSMGPATGLFWGGMNVQNGRLHKVVTDSTQMIRVKEETGYNSILRNVEIIAPDTNNACAGDCQVILIDFNASAADFVTIENVTIADWEGTKFTRGIASDEGTTEDKFVFGSILVANMNHTDGDFDAIELGATAIGLIDDSAGGVCLSANEASGTYTPLVNIGSYATEPELSWTPGLQGGSMRADARAISQKCGAPGGKGRPGRSPVDPWVEEVLGFEFGANVYNTEGM